MTALAVYSTDLEPERLYSTDDFGHGVDDRIRQFVHAGDRPLDLLVDFQARRVLWLFKARRSTATTRTGYFLADYRGEGDTDLFRGFERAIRTLHESDDWALPYRDDAQWDAGFNLWRVDRQYPDVDSSTVASFRDALDTPSRQDEPLVFGMHDHHSAQQVVTALDADGHDCTVAVGEGPQDILDGLDLVLVPGASDDFEPQSAAARTVFDEPDTSAASRSTESTVRFEQPSVGSRIGGAVLLVILAFSAFSFISPKPFHPITGLAAFGGLVGSVFGYATLTADATDSVEAIVGRFHRRVLENVDQSVVILAYGTTIGFAFPTIFRIGGQLLGGGQWVFGPVTTLGNTLLSLALFGVVLAVVNYGVLSVYPRVVPGETVAYQWHRFVLAHVAYAVPLLVLTGLARSVWFGVVPSV